MKIDIDLSEIFEDEEGGVFQIDVKDRIIKGAIDNVSNRISKEIETQISAAINSIITETVTKKLESLVESMLDLEYEERTSWGEGKGKITVRNKIFKTIESQMVYNPGRYSNEQNAYTRSVQEAVEKSLSAFKDQYKKEVDAVLAKEMLNTAIEKIKERMGIKS